MLLIMTRTSIHYFTWEIYLRAMLYIIPSFGLILPAVLTWYIYLLYLPDIFTCSTYLIYLPVVLTWYHRYKFFGNRSERTCGICSGPRRGRSTFRRGTLHADRWAEIQRLQRIVDAGTRLRKRGREHIDAEASLERKGFHALKRCRLIQRCPRSLLTVPGRVFGGLFGFDVMHAIFINWCSYYLVRTHSSMTDKMRETFIFIPTFTSDSCQTCLSGNSIR